MKGVVRSFGSNVVLPLGLSFSVFFTGGCTVLSKRTDDQAWLEYQSDAVAYRLPASTTHSQEILSQINFRQLLISCRGPAERDCFQLGLKRTIDQFAGDKMSFQERSEFLSTHSFDDIQKDVLNFHRRLLSGMDFRAGERVKHLVSACTGDLAKKYQCSKAHWNEDAQVLFQETIDRLGLVVSRPETRDYIIEKQILPEYEKVTRTLIWGEGGKE